MEIKRLNRFTTLPILLDLLKRKKLVLLDPNTWDDRNDTKVILEYKKRMNIESLFALCFAHESETIHHWKTFSNGTSGCCIEFNAKKLFKIIDGIKGLKHKPIIYKTLSDIEKKPVDLELMPFTKRWPYRCEEEYRIIWEGTSDAEFFEIEIPLSIINKITISQQMPQGIFNTIKEYLRDSHNNPESKINRSTIYENKRWINSFKEK